MKKGIVYVIVTALLLLIVPCFAEASESDLCITINGERLKIPADMGALFIDGQSRAQIPIRAISEGLGHEVKWNSSTRTVTIIKSEKEAIQITVGSNQVITPDNTIIMDTQAVIIGGRTYVPLRFVSEALGYHVDYQWNGFHTISITDSVVKPAFNRPHVQNLPDEIKKWVEYSKDVPLVQERTYDGKRYVLITEGEKRSGGYAVEVIEVVETGDSLVLKVKRTKPAPEDMVTDALTYPYDLIVLENKELPLSFLDVDDESYIFMNLHGIDYIDRPIVATSDWIKIFTPKLEEDVVGAFQLTGIANVHEGTVSYDLKTKTGDVILSGFTTAAFTVWGYFEEEIQVPQELGETDLDLELYSISMKDGSQMFKVTIPLTIKP